MTHGPGGGPLLLRALWWRRGFTAAVLAVAVVTTSAAALGPLYARAVGESTLNDHLTQAGATTGLRLTATLGLYSPASYDQILDQAPKPGSIHGYDRVIAGLSAPVTAWTNEYQAQVQTTLAWRQGVCKYVVMVRGRCPDRAGDAMVSQRTAASLLDHPGLGRALSVAATGPLASATQELPPINGVVSIVGIYQPIDTSSTFWFNHAYFDFAPGSVSGAALGDAVFIAKAEFQYLSLTTPVHVDFDYPLTPSAIRLDDVPAERAAVAHLLAKYPRTSPIQARTGLPKVLNEAAHDQHLADIGTLLVVLQLALLAWFVLFHVIAEAIEARGDEIALAKLRGHPPSSVLRFGLGETMVLLTLAVPLGLAFADLIGRMFALWALAPGVPVVFTWRAVVTAVIAFGGGVLAAALAAHRTLTRPVLDQWRHTAGRARYGRQTVAIQALLMAAAVTAIILLRQHHRPGSQTGTLALIAPGLLVLAVALVGVRLLPVATRWLVRQTRASRHVGAFLAVRQIARRPVALRLAALLAVAVGLATFAVAAESIAISNRIARARAEVGAERVADIQFGATVDPITATQLADPNGRWAMAAAAWLPFDSNSIAGPILGVDSSRLASVGYPAPGGPSNQTIAQTLRAAAPPITISTTRLRVHLRAVDLTGDQRPDLQLNLRSPAQRYLNIEGRAVTDGAHAYVLAVPCAAGCGLHGLTWDRPVRAQGRLGGTITLTGIDARVRDGQWQPLDLGLARSGSWHAGTPQGTATDRVAETDAGVIDRFSNADGGYGGITYADPSPIPMIATPGVVAPPRPVGPASVADGSPEVARVTLAATDTVLPVVLAHGVITDVRYLSDELPDMISEARWEVWLGPNAPHDALDRLRAQGLQIEDIHTATTRVDQLGRQGPALALLLLLACAIAGAILTAGGTAISINTKRRNRAYEIAALSAVGVARRALLRAGIAEQLLLLGTALVLGVPTGIAAARIAMPVIPEFADPTPIRLNYDPSWLPILAFSAGFAVLLAFIAIAAAQLLIRAASPSRLREPE